MLIFFYERRAYGCTKLMFAGECLILSSNSYDSLLRHQIIYVVFLLSIAVMGSTRAFSFSPEDSLQYKKISLQLHTDPVIGSDSNACVIPFSRAGNLILVRAKADTIDGNFILDTGAPRLVLNITYFRDYPSVNVADEEQGSVNSTGNAFRRTMIDKFVLGAFRYSKVDADLTSLGNIENSKGVKILGLLGMELFNRFEMIIDYEKNLIYLRMPAKKESGIPKNPMLADTASYNTIPFDITENKLIIKTEMGGKKLKMMIDCGAESNVLDSRLPDKVFENVVISRRVLLNGSSNKKVDALYGNMNDISIAGEKIASLPVIITNLEKSCLNYSSCIDGILGFDFLSLHKIGFNFVTRKMYIWK